MTVGRLEKNAPDTFLGFTSWKEDADTASSGSTEFTQRAQVGLERGTIRSILARSDEGLLADAVFALRKPVEIAALIGRATAEQYSVLQEICDALRGENPLLGCCRFHGHEV